MAAARSTIRVLRGMDYAHVWRLGGNLQAGLGKALERAGIEARAEGRGPYTRLVASAAHQPQLLLFLGHMAEHGCLFSHNNPILPSFAHSDADIASTIAIANEYRRP